MSRALDLFNRTNQFNTTGARYTLEQCHQHFASGRRLYVVQAEDRFTQYGLIGAAWVRQNCIDHLVLSCRALGLGIEDAFLGHIAHRLAEENATAIAGELQQTDANLACRQLYSRNGFVQAHDKPMLWSRSLKPPALSFRLTLHSLLPAKNTRPSRTSRGRKDKWDKSIGRMKQAGSIRSNCA